MKFLTCALLALPTLALAQFPVDFKMAIGQHLRRAEGALGDVVSALDECKAPNFVSRMDQLIANMGAAPAPVCYVPVPVLQQLNENFMGQLHAKLFNLFVEYGGPVVQIEFWRDQGEVKVLTPARIATPTTMLRPFKARQQLLGQMAEIGALAQAVAPSAPIPPVPAVPAPNPEEFANAPPLEIYVVKLGRIVRTDNFPADYLVQLDKAAVNRNVPAAAARWVEALAGSVIPSLKKEVEAEDPATLSPQKWLQRVGMLNQMVGQLMELTMAAESRTTAAYARHFKQLMANFAE